MIDRATRPACSCWLGDPPNRACRAHGRAQVLIEGPVADMPKLTPDMRLPLRIAGVVFLLSGAKHPGRPWQLRLRGWLPAKAADMPRAH